MVVETSPDRFQALWMLKKPSADLDRIEAINHSIASRHGGDSNCCDRARVLRLPGFRNLKYAAQPYARLVVCRPDRLFTVEQLEAAFPAVASTSPSGHSSRSHHRDVPTWLGLVFAAVVDYLSAMGLTPHPSADGGVMARCPLHNDRNPSLSVHPTRGWKCCGVRCRRQLLNPPQPVLEALLWKWEISLR
jgi:hypothetical protein